MKLTFTGYFLLVFSYLCASVDANQNSLDSLQIDSLHLVLAQEKDLTVSIQTKLALVSAYIGIDDSLANNYLDQILALSNKATEIQLGKVWYYKGLIDVNNGKEIEAVLKIRKAIDYFSHDETEVMFELANCHMNIGRANRMAGDYFLALNSFNKGLDYLDREENKNTFAKCANNIGVIYSMINDNEKAKEYYLLCKELNSEVNNQEDQVYLLNNLGYLEEEEANYQAAIEYYNDGLDLVNEIGFDLMEVHLLSNLVGVFVRLENYEKALEYLNKGKQLAIDQNETRLLKFFQLHEAEISFKKDTSLVYKDTVVSILAFAKEKKYNYMSNMASELLEKFYFQNNEFEKAYKLSNELWLHKDSTNNIKLAIEAAFIDAKLLHAKKENKQIIESQKSNFLKNLLSVIIASLLLLLLLSTFFVRKLKKSFVKEVKQNILLKEKDKALTLSSKELEDRNKKLKLYIESNTQLEKFARATSHDIKTPLRTIASFAELLNKSAESKLSEKELDHLSYVIAGTRRLGTITNDLLNFSSINGKTLNLEYFDVNKLVDNILLDFTSIILESKAVILLEPLPEKIYADKVKLRRVFQNLIENSIKYSSKEGFPEIKISYLELKDYFEFSVSDNGVGIKEEDFETIFNSFSRLKNAEDQQGVGLGLSIVKNNIEKHGGKIWINPQKGIGAEFKFTIPKNHQDQ